LDEKEVEYIRQVNAKEIDEAWFRELVFVRATLLT
jgi:hypothetical protein